MATAVVEGPAPARRDPAGYREMLRARWLGLRFLDTGVEQRYRRWRADTALPYTMVGYAGSGVGWVLFIALLPLVEPVSVGRAEPPLVAWLTVHLVQAWALSRTRARRWLMPVTAATTALAGCLIAWLLHQATGSTIDPEVRAGLMAGGMMIHMGFAFAAFRLPPEVSVVVVLPGLALATTYLVGDVTAGLLAMAEGAAFVAIQAIGFVAALGAGMVQEASTRRTFGKDLIIQLQRDQLETSWELVRRYVPTPLAERIGQGDDVTADAPARIRVTVLFCDIVDFTRLADRVEPEVATEVINGYMSAVTELVEAHEGTVTDFIGDGVLALFGAPHPLPAARQATQAVAAARGIQALLPELNRRWRREGLTDDLRLRIGINTGVASVGSFGSEGRVTYTAIGMQVNIANRLQSQCPPGGILLSDTTFQLLDGAVACRPLGEVTIKGAHFPVLVHTPLDGAATIRRVGAG